MSEWLENHSTRNIAIAVANRLLAAISVSLLLLVIIFSSSYSSYVFGQKGFLLYENLDYNIKIQYPSNWTKQEVNLSPLSPVFFHTPTQYSFETPNASLNVFVFVSQSNSTVDSFANNIRSSDDEKIKNREIRLINSSFTTLAGLRGWQQVYYDYSSSKNVKTLMIFTIKNGEVYQLQYRSEPGEYNHYLPIAEKMIKSFQITK
jgi:hypothetical protein